MRIRRILTVVVSAILLTGVLLADTASAAGPAPAQPPGTVLRQVATTYSVMGQLGTATVDAFAAGRARTRGAIRVFDPATGLLTGAITGAKQATDGTITLNGRGRLAVGDSAPIAVRFVLTANPTSKAVIIEITKVNGGASAGKLSGTLTNGLIRVVKPVAQ